jgi:hypothetical protein
MEGHEMKKRILRVLVALTGMFLFSASIVWSAPAPVPKTGLTSSYYTGDDGDLQKGVGLPSWIPRFIDNGDGTVTDNLTGLMWAKNANIANGYKGWSVAISYANSLSLGSECGTPHTDWRLPNVKELQSLMDYGNFSPALPSGHPFSNVQSGVYWSSTTYVAYGTNTWIVELPTGRVNNAIKTHDGYIWPVRGGN